MLQLLTKYILYLFRELANHFIYFRKNQSRLSYWGSFEIVNCDSIQISNFFSLQAVFGRSGTWQPFLVPHFLCLPSERAFFIPFHGLLWLFESGICQEVPSNPESWLLIYLFVCLQPILFKLTQTDSKLCLQQITKRSHARERRKLQKKYLDWTFNSLCILYIWWL